MSLVTCAGVSSFALSEIQLTGEANLATTLTQLPSRNSGVVAFSLPALRLNLEIPLRDNNEIFVQLESAESRDATSKRFDTQLKEAYVKFSSFLPANSELRYGLVPTFWNELGREQWDYDFWGPTSELPQIKYNYSSWSDLGLRYQSELANDLGFWAFTISNGEGLESDEVGPRKQYELLLAMTKAAPFYVTLSYGQGSYDNYDPSFNEKMRAMINLSYEQENAMVALEYFEMKDPA
ncbi:MAG: hypothetical protein EOP06_24030, partial [Proteobacteria bacterium]